MITREMFESKVRESLASIEDVDIPMPQSDMLDQLYSLDASEESRIEQAVGYALDVYYGLYSDSCDRCWVVWMPI